MFLEKTSGQLRQYIDAEAVHGALAQARTNAARYAGSMFWREANGTSYLIRSTADSKQKSLGPKTKENADAVGKFSLNKAEAEGRVKSLKSELEMHQKINKAMRVGRTPNLVTSIINAVHDAQLDAHFMVIGTHALYAYETAAGVTIPNDAMATQDIDLLFDTRKHLKFFTQMKRLDTSFLDLLKKVDKSFQLRADQRYTAVNDKGFEIDVVRRMAGDVDPHPMRLSDDEDDFWAVQIPSGNHLLGARPFEQVVVSTHGQMAKMKTVHPLDFARIKQAMGLSATRDPLKAPKDLLQASLVRQLVSEYLPHLLERQSAINSQDAPGALPKPT